MFCAGSLDTYDSFTVSMSRIQRREHYKVQKANDIRKARIERDDTKLNTSIAKQRQLLQSQILEVKRNF